MFLPFLFVILEEDLLLPLHSLPRSDGFIA
jgi:hypothetical protein